MSRRWISGLDLGQSQDYSALVSVEQVGSRDERGATVCTYAVRGIRRWHLGTPYPTIVSELRDHFQKQPLTGSVLVVDHTGVGRPVVDLIRTSGIYAQLAAYTITAGFKEGDGTVPKRDLVGAVQACLSMRRVKIAPTLPHAATLGKELEAFQVKVTDDRNETFAAGRERDHDDLVLSLALALWVGEKMGPPALGRESSPYVMTAPAEAGWDHYRGQW